MIVKCEFECMTIKNNSWLAYIGVAMCVIGARRCVAMVDARDVAHYILKRREETEHSTTTFALQKLMYLCKGWSLVAADDPLFDDAVSAWSHGPVVDSIWPYCRNKRYIKSWHIPVSADEDTLSPLQKCRIDRVLDCVNHIDDEKLGDELEEMSHEQSPWKDARLSADEIITDDSIADYFEMLEVDPPESQKKFIPDMTDLSTRTFITDEDMEWIEKTFA